MKKLITIVIPSKNEEKYIGYLLDDLAKQVEDTRIIIADSSSDKTRSIIEQKRLQHNLNIEVISGGPVSQAKNSGAKLVTTPYILFIDADVRFFNNKEIIESIKYFENHNLDLLGLYIKCYDNDIRTKIGFTIFNFCNWIMQHFLPFAVGAFMLVRKDKFDKLGGFPCKYQTSEDFFLSKQFDPKKFKLLKYHFGQDSRRFRKMGYFGMTKYLIKNFLNRNNEKYWDKIDYSNYWD